MRRVKPRRTFSQMYRRLKIKKKLKKKKSKDIYLTQLIKKVKNKKHSSYKSQYGKRSSVIGFLIVNSLLTERKSFNTFQRKISTLRKDLSFHRSVHI